MSFGNRATRSPALVGGAVLFGLILTAAILAPILAPYSPSAQNLTGGLLPPSPEHWLGTDQLGRDVLSRLLFAARTDLRIAILASLAPFVIGVTVGLVSGYFGGAVDWTASRITDTVIAFPFYVIVIAIVFAVGAGEAGIILAFALVGWVGYARVLRAMTASLREAGWVQAARGGGLSHARVLLRHLLPNVLPQAVVLLATEIVLIMVAIVTLGYLGLGIQPPTPDWGTMIADAQQFVTTQWWLAAFPGLAVVVTGIALSLLGDGLGDALRAGSAPGAAAGRGRSAAKREPGWAAASRPAKCGCAGCGSPRVLLAAPGPARVAASGRDRRSSTGSPSRWRRARRSASWGSPDRARASRCAPCSGCCRRARARPAARSRSAARSAWCSRIRSRRSIRSRVWARSCARPSRRGTLRDPGLACVRACGSCCGRWSCPIPTASPARTRTSCPAASVSAW